MIDLLLLTLCCSLFILGWWHATNYTPVVDVTADLGSGNLSHMERKPEKTELLWFLKYYTRVFLCQFLDFLEVEYATKPLFGCPVCMASVYGTLFYWGRILFHGQIINSLTLVLWVVVVVMVAGLNKVLLSLSGR